MLKIKIPNRRRLGLIGPDNFFVIRLALYLFFLLMLAAALAGFWVYHEIVSPYKGYEGDGKFVEIGKGASVRQIAALLEQEGIISHCFPFIFYLAVARRGETLKAGEYYFEGRLSQIEVIDKLIRGRIYYHTVTVPEGKNIYEVAELLAASGIASRESLLAEMGNVTLISDLDGEAKNLEGYLFPDTYYFPRRVTVGEIIGKMVARFKDVFDESYRQRAQELGLSVRQVVTLASLIEKEAGRDEERSLIAGVFMNRLRLGIPLQCDATVIYALVRAGGFDGDLKRDHLRMDSPYNTYKYVGLPPGPIANPGRKSIEAALYPAPVRFLFFVSRNDGTHEFSTTLHEHNLAVEKYQRSLSTTFNQQQ